jgi:hypothetical protein
VRQTDWHLIGYSVYSPSIVMHMPAAESGQAKHCHLATGFIEVWLQDTGALPMGTKNSSNRTQVCTIGHRDGRSPTYPYPLSHGFSLAGPPGRSYLKANMDKQSNQSN